MATPNRASALNQTQKVLKKHFKPIQPVERSLLDQLLYACCLENTRYEKADECFARLQESYFDWNEVRVTSVRELSHVMRGVHDATAAATGLKQALQSIFETFYAFDLEFMAKQNLGLSVKQLEKHKGIPRFAISYLTQHGLGGHSIPIDAGALDIFYIAGAISQAEGLKGVVPGLERSVPKTKGVEFGSLLHQFSAEYMASPHSAKVKSMLAELAKDAKERMPKRGKKRAVVPPEPEPAPEPKPVASKGTTAKGADQKKKKAKPADKSKPTTDPKKKKLVKKKVVKKKKATVSKKKKKKVKKTTTKKKKSASKQLARRKPR